MADQPETYEYDVTIVGGGVAGSYVAYRMARAAQSGDFEPGSILEGLWKANGNKLSIGLFEYSGRIGGRLLSAQLPDAPAPDDNPDDDDYLRYTEFGGFRYQPQMHIVRDLANQLGLTHQPFPVDEPSNNPVLLRGKPFDKGELSGSGATAVDAYNMSAFEKAIVQGVYTWWGTPSLDTFIANQVFASVLENTPFTKALPVDPKLSEEQKAQLANNGWFCLQQNYAKAFIDQDWDKVDELRKQYEAAKQTATYQDRRFIDWPWWGLRSALLSFEAIAFEEDSGGYNTRYSSGNGPQGIIENFYFSDQVTEDLPQPGSPPPTLPNTMQFKNVGNPLYTSVCLPDYVVQDAGDPCTNTIWKHVSEGYAAIPNQLYEGFTGAGGNIPKGAADHVDNRNRQLLSFDKTDDGGYELLFFKRESNQAVTTAQALAEAKSDPAAAVQVKTRLLVLAMPKRSLDLLVQENFFFRDRTVQSLLDTVIQVPAQRVFMAYEKPWWTSGRGTPSCGRSTTDLGVRQFYYWMTSKKGEASTVLASYTNGQAEEYWRPMQTATAMTYDDLPGARPRAELVPPNTPDKLDAAYPQGRGPRAATKTMGDLAHAQLKEVVGVPDAPEPYYVHYQDWVVDPWGGGWHAWKAGSDDDTIIPQVMHAIPEENVYICGEAWSNVQGWVQGALNTSETLVQKLGLPWPTWLQKDGTWLGPGSDS